MRMKSETSLRLALLFPYVVEVFFIPLVQSLPASLVSEANLSDIESALYLIVFLLWSLAGAYIFTADYWLIPYTILAVILGLWSIKKNKKQIIARFMWSPIYLTALAFLYSLIPAIRFEKIFPVPFEGNSSLHVTLSLNFCAIPVMMVVGYMFISILLWIYSGLLSQGVIVDDDTSTPFLIITE